MIRIANASKLGPALADVRNMLGLSRPDHARLIVAINGRSLKGTINQLHDWDKGINAPGGRALGPALQALGYDLALVPREEA